MWTEIKDKESKLKKNLRSESNSYDGEVENVKKSLISAKENLETFRGILSDFENKLNPVDASYNKMITKKNFLRKRY